SLAIGALHAGTKLFQSAELKLLHGSFTPPEFLRNFPNALLLNKAQHQNPALVLGKTLHQLEKSGALLNLFHANVFRIVANGVPSLTRCFPPAIDHAMCRNANQPCSKRSSTPLELS